MKPPPRDSALPPGEAAAPSGARPAKVFKVWDFVAVFVGGGNDVRLLWLRSDRVSVIVYQCFGPGADAGPGRFCNAIPKGGSSKSTFETAFED